ncbi:MFS transporter [Streptomyces longhuiensis]|uniref:MFS transporter n=1 Tax=Streptomyces TaxID=1883 RepID=UPI001D0AC3D9|nr:MFS transporter [Streptomyces longhuiensis]UDL97086.1 MFS transporter [Streptomyces longhuiensis]
MTPHPDTDPVVVEAPPRQTRPGAEPPRGRAWLITAMLTALMVINFGDKVVLGIAAKPLMRELDISKAQYGLVASAFFFLFGVSSVAVGFLANRMSTKWLLLGMAVIWSAAMMPIVLVATLPALLGSRLLLGAAEGPTLGIAQHSVQKWFPDSRRALPTAVVNIGAALGVVIAPVLTYLTVHHGWRAPFTALAVAGLVWGLVWTAVGKEGPLTTFGVGQGQDVVVDEPHVPYRKLLLSRTFVGMCAGGFAAYSTIALMLTWLPAYLEDVDGFSEQHAGSFLAVPRAVAVVLELAVPVLADRWMRRGASRRAARAGTAAVILVVAGAALAAALLPGSGGGPLHLALFTVAFSVPSIVFIFSALIVVDISPVGQRGATLGIGTAVMTSAGVIAPALMGALTGLFDDPGVGYRVGFLVPALAMILGGIAVALWVHPERDAERLGLK